ncbi:uncharacterized protein V6R79_021472 [Siganus canaliculatus]
MDIVLDQNDVKGWTISSCILHQYHFVPEQMNWTEAQTHCRQKYTDLATIDNSEEMKLLNDTVLSSGLNSDVWIGLYTHIDWKWSDGYNGSGAEYRRWYSGRPGNYDGELCILMGAFKQEDRDTYWDDGCAEAWAFTCDNGTDFIFVKEPKTWSDAQSYCRENYKDLATVRSDEDSKRIPTIWLNGPYGSWYWIGLFREKNHLWSDGSKSSFTYWGGSFPPAGERNVLCAAADLQNSGKWKFLSCDTTLPSVCHSLVHRQVVKLRMKPGDSSVDLNDPAVKAAVLKKLQDRLKEQGVSGVNLKWREQPDGKVFHKEAKSPKRKRRQTEL